MDEGGITEFYSLESCFVAVESEFLSQKEENKYLYNNGRLANAYATRTKGFGRASFGGSAPNEGPVGPPAVNNPHSKKNNPLIGVALLIALLVCFALFFGILHW